MKALIALLMLTLPARSDTLTGPLAGKSYIIQMSSTQYSSGYAEELLPPLYAAMTVSGMRAQGGEGADLVVNVETQSDVGRWVEQGGDRVWLYTISATVGISPESFDIPYDGTPAFGARASLMTTNPDRPKEWQCLITLAARTALQNYRPTGLVGVDGQACNRAR